jgi:blocked-early-in-transport protein 1
MYQRKTASSNGSGHNSNSSNMYSRGSSGGYGGRDVEGGRYNDTNANILEQQNNERIYELSEQVARLKVRF